MWLQSSSNLFSHSPTVTFIKSWEYLDPAWSLADLTALPHHVFRRCNWELNNLWSGWDPSGVGINLYISPRGKRDLLTSAPVAKVSFSTTWSTLLISTVLPTRVFSGWRFSYNAGYPSTCSLFSLELTRCTILCFPYATENFLGSYGLSLSAAVTEFVRLFF